MSLEYPPRGTFNGNSVFTTPAVNVTTVKLDGADFARSGNPNYSYAFFHFSDLGISTEANYSSLTFYQYVPTTNMVAGRADYWVQLFDRVESIFVPIATYAGWPNYTAVPVDRPVINCAKFVTRTASVNPPQPFGQLTQIPEAIVSPFGPTPLTGSSSSQAVSYLHHDLYVFIACRDDQGILDRKCHLKIVGSP